MNITVSFKYKNHRGVTSQRTVDVDSIEFIFKPNPEYGYQPCWFLTGYCHDKKARRSFALSNIVFEADDDNMYYGSTTFYRLALAPLKETPDVKD